MSALSRARAVNVRKDETRRMEDEARRMEAKLEVLRRTMDNVDQQSSARGEGGGRWSAGSSSKPIRSGYVKGVLDAPIGRAAPKPRGAQRAPSEGRAPESGGGSGNATPTGAAKAAGTFGDILGVADTAPPGTTTAPTPARAGKAASNLQAAMSQQSGEEREVENFLADLKLDRYVSLFLENGFDCMEVVQEMQESHMRELGMAAGHVIKLQKRLSELRPEPPAPDPSATGTQRRVTFGATEEAQVPKAASGPASNKLSDGLFSEEESAASFQEALRAWREGRDASETPSKAGDSGAAGAGSEANSAPKAAGSFWSTVGGGDLEVARCSTPVRAPTEPSATDSTVQHDPAPSEERLACYQCYKQFFAKFAVERTATLDVGGPTTKRLCSEACADRWAKAMEDKAEQHRKRQEKLSRIQEAKRALDEQLANGSAEAAQANADA